jgi:hypothetical protein
MFTRYRQLQLLRVATLDTTSLAALSTPVAAHVGESLADASPMVAYRSKMIFSISQRSTSLLKLTSTILTRLTRGRHVEISGSQNHNTDP